MVGLHCYANSKVKHFFFSVLVINRGWRYFIKTTELLEIYLIHSWFVILSRYSSLTLWYVLNISSLRLVCLVRYHSLKLQPRPGFISNKLKQMHINPLPSLCWGFRLLPITHQSTLLSR
jgi:hypothetical protein